jgi:hypothetical protein
MNDHKITDTFLAATLVALGFKVLLINRDNPQRCVFLFENTAEINLAIQNYLLGQLTVNPTTLLQAYKYVLSQIHDYDK